MQNKKRALRAAKALAQYNNDEWDVHTSLVDLLTDLFHLDARSDEVDLKAALRTARGHFAAEQEEEQ